MTEEVLTENNVADESDAGKLAKRKADENDASEDAKKPKVEVDSNGDAGNVETGAPVVSEIDPASAEPEAPVVEDLFAVFVSARRRNFKLSDELVSDIKQAFMDEGFDVIDTFSSNQFNFHARLSSADQVEKCIAKFHKSLVTGVVILVKDQYPVSREHLVRLKPSNPNIKLDYELSDELQDELRKMDIDFHGCKVVRDHTEVDMNLVNKEDIDKVISRFNNSEFGYLNLLAEQVTDDEDSEGPPADPFVYATMKTNTTTFTPENQNVVKQLFSVENIEVTRTTIANAGKFASFYVNSWEDVDNFVSKYGDKIINKLLIHFEKGTKRCMYSQNPQDYHQHRGNRGGGGGPHRGYRGGAPHMGGYPRGGGGGGYYNSSMQYYGGAGGYYPPPQAQPPAWRGGRGGYRGW